MASRRPPNQLQNGKKNSVKSQTDNNPNQLVFKFKGRTTREWRQRNLKTQSEAQLAQTRAHVLSILETDPAIATSRLIEVNAKLDGFPSAKQSTLPYLKLRVEKLTIEDFIRRNYNEK